MPAFFASFFTSKEQGADPALQNRDPSFPNQLPLPSWGSIGKALFLRAGPGLLIAEADRRSQPVRSCFSHPPSPARREKAAQVRMHAQGRTGRHSHSVLLSRLASNGTSFSGGPHYYRASLPRRVTCVPASPFPEMIPKPRVCLLGLTPSQVTLAADPAGRCATQARGSIVATAGFAFRGACVECHPRSGSGADRACLGNGGLWQWKVQGEM